MDIFLDSRYTKLAAYTSKDNVDNNSTNSNGFTAKYEYIDKQLYNTLAFIVKKNIAPKS